MTVRQWLESHKCLDRQRAIEHCSRELKVSRDRVAEVYNEANKQKAKQSGRKLADFRASFDKSYIVPAKIKAGLASMSGDWLYELEFAKHCGISLADVGSFRDQFAEKHVLQIKERRVWCRTESLKNTMKEML